MGARPAPGRRRARLAAPGPGRSCVRRAAPQPKPPPTYPRKRGTPAPAAGDPGIGHARSPAVPGAARDGPRGAAPVRHGPVRPARHTVASPRRKDGAWRRTWRRSTCPMAWRTPPPTRSITHSSSTASPGASGRWWSCSPTTTTTRRWTSWSAPRAISASASTTCSTPATVRGSAVRRTPRHLLALARYARRTVVPSFASMADVPPISGDAAVGALRDELGALIAPQGGATAGRLRRRGAAPRARRPTARRGSG